MEKTELAELLKKVSSQDLLLLLSTEQKIGLKNYKPTAEEIAEMLGKVYPLIQQAKEAYEEMGIYVRVECEGKMMSKWEASKTPFTTSTAIPPAAEKKRTRITSETLKKYLPHFLEKIIPSLPSAFTSGELLQSLEKDEKAEYHSALLKHIKKSNKDFKKTGEKASTTYQYKGK
jgi:hypothetical protein